MTFASSGVLESSELPLAFMTQNRQYPMAIVCGGAALKWMSMNFELLSADNAGGGVGAVEFAFVHLPRTSSGVWGAFQLTHTLAHTANILLNKHAHLFNPQRRVSQQTLCVRNANAHSADERTEDGRMQLAARSSLPHTFAHSSFGLNNVRNTWHTHSISVYTCIAVVVVYRSV